MKAFSIACILFALGFGGLLQAAPAANFEIKETAPVSLDNIQWHEREGGWLFTCRLTVRSEHLIKPVSYLEFEGFKNGVNEGDETEVLWTKTRTIHRRKLDSKLGGSVGMFIRVHVTDVPEEVEGMTLTFVNEPPSGRKSS